MQVIFENPRLLLRHFTEQDAPLIYKLNGNTDIVKYIHKPVLKNEAEASKLITNIIFLKPIKPWQVGDIHKI